MPSNVFTQNSTFHQNSMRNAKHKFNLSIKSYLNEFMIVWGKNPICTGVYPFNIRATTITISSPLLFTWLKLLCKLKHDNWCLISFEETGGRDYLLSLIKQHLIFIFVEESMGKPPPYHFPYLFGKTIKIFPAFRNSHF